MPIAKYISGATTFPVYPTYKSLDIIPASTAALEAPIAQFYLPNVSAISCSNLKFSLLFSALPPLTTYFADVKSAISDFETMFSMNYSC